MNKKLAEDLKIAKGKARDNIVRSGDLPDMTFRRLKKLNWLSEITRGWYILKTPDVDNGESTLWYASFWTFLKYFLVENYKDEYCLNPLSSIFLKTESNTIPSQVVIILKSGGARTLKLPFDTSIVFYPEKKNYPENIEEFRGINTIELPKAITMVPESFYTNYENEAELVLKMIKAPGDITKYLLDDEQPVKANIISGAYDFLEMKTFVTQIKEDMKILTYTIKPKNPFQRKVPLLGNSRIESPAVARIEILWKKYKEELDKEILKPSLLGENLDEMLEKVDKIYVHDAYNSLSIEGYSVTEELIQKIADGSFDAEASEEDKKQEAAMAAKGYYLAFQEVKEFIKNNYGKSNNEIKVAKEISTWYRNLFTPKVQSGLAKASVLTGYRNKPVFIRGSRHTPVNYSFVNEVMEKYLEMIDTEENPWTRALLGHFILVFIHPFSDGNGRTARFLMNALLVLSGHNWTVIRQQERTSFFSSLEQASVHGEIKDFTNFIKQELEESSKWSIAEEQKLN